MSYLLSTALKSSIASFDRRKLARQKFRSPQALMFEPMEGRVLLSIDPTATEQFSLELINHMRADPMSHLARMVSSFNPLSSPNTHIDFALDFFNVNGDVLLAQWQNLVSVPPLAWNESLYNAAKTHNQLMIDQDEQSHQLPGEADFATRMTAAGYGDFLNLAENVFTRAEDPFAGHGGFAIDWGNTPTGIQNPPGHRDNMMSPLFKEIGLVVQEENNPATESGPFVITHEFGNRSSLINPYVLGSIFDDKNANGFYDMGEGLAGVTITLKSASQTFVTTSMTAGGFQANIPQGIYDITYSGGKFTSPLVREDVVVGKTNVMASARLQEMVINEPDIRVTGNGAVIVNGDATPSVAEGTLTTIPFNGPGSPTHTFSFSIANTGSQPLLLTDPILTGGYTFKTTPPASIGAGQSTTFSVSFTPVNPGTIPGTFSVTTNDPDTKTYSFSLASNVVATPPTLTGTSISLGLINALPNTTVPVSIILSNTSSVPANGADVEFFLSKNTILDGTDIRASTLTTLETILADGTFKLSGEIKLPASIPLGSYFLVARIGSGGFTGVSSPSAQQLTIQATPDLTILVNPTTGTFSPGDFLKSTTTIKNIGLGGSNPTTARVVLSADKILGNADDILLQTLDIPGINKAGSSANVTNLRIPTDTADGKYFILASIDPDNKIAETSETNNTFIAATALVVQRPTISLTTVSKSFSETSGAGSFTITRAGGSKSAVVTTALQYTGSATLGEDYKLLVGGVFVDSPNITFAANQTSITVRLVAIDDSKIEPTEDIQVNLLSDPATPTTYLVNSAKSVANFTLVDNEPTVSLKAITTKTSETGGAATFQIARTGGSTKMPLTVFFDVSGTALQNTDYKITTIDGKTTLDNSFTLNANVAAGTFKLMIIDDELIEGNETATLSLATSPGEPTYSINASLNTGSVVIADNEPTISLKAITTKTSETKGAATFMITRSGGSTKVPLTVFFDVSGTALQNTDYKITTIDGKTTLDNSFTLNTNVASGSFKLMIIDDSLIEGDETATLTLALNPGEPAYTIDPTKKTGSVLITDNEPTVSIKAVTTKTTETKGSATYQITRTGGATNTPLTVFFNTSGTALQNTDYKLTSLDGKTELSNSITLTSASISFKLQVIDDSLVESEETAIITLEPNPGSPAYTIDPSKNTGSVLIADNEPIISVTATKPNTSEGSVTAGQFKFLRVGPSTTSDQIVHFSLTGTATIADDYALFTATKGSTLSISTDDGKTTGTLIIPKGQTSALLDVRSFFDGPNDPNETVIATLLANEAYRLSAISSATVRIANINRGLLETSPLAGLPGLGSRLIIGKATSTVTNKTDVLGGPGTTLQSIIKGPIQSSESWVGQYTYVTQATGASARRIIFTSITQPSAPGVFIQITLNFDLETARPANLAGRQINLYPDGASPANGHYIITGLPGNPDQVFTGVFQLS